MTKFPNTIFVKYEDAGDGTTFLNPSEDRDTLVSVGERVMVARYALAETIEFEGVVRPVK